MKVILLYKIKLLKDVERLYRYLCVEDPFCTHRNLANSADGTSVEGIRQEMERSVRILHSGGEFKDVCSIFKHPTPHVRTTSHPPSPTRGAHLLSPTIRVSRPHDNQRHKSHSHQNTHTNQSIQTITQSQLNGLHHNQYTNNNNINHIHGGPYMIHPFYQHNQKTTQTDKLNVQFDSPLNPNMNTYEPISPISGSRLQSSGTPQAYFYNFPPLTQSESTTASGFSSPGADSINPMDLNLSKLEISDSPSIKNPWQFQDKHDLNSELNSKPLETSHASSAIPNTISYNTIVKGTNRKEANINSRIKKTQEREKEYEKAKLDEKFNNLEFGTHRRTQSTKSQR